MAEQGFLSKLRKDFAKATDIDEGGFQTNHTNRSAKAFVKWYRLMRLQQRREALANERAQKAHTAKELPAATETPHPKTDAKATVTPEAPAETRPDVTAEAKPEVKPEVKVEVKPEVTPEAKPEVKPEVKAEVKPEVTPEAKPEVKPEVKAEATPEVKTEVKPEVKPEVAVDAKPEVKAPEKKAGEVKAAETHAPEIHAPEAGHAPAGGPVEAPHGSGMSTKTKFLIGAAVAEAGALGNSGPKKKPSIGKYGSVGLSAYGVVTSVGGLKKAIHEGDGYGITLNSATLTVSAADLTANAFKFAGKADKVFKYIKVLDKANIFLNVADIAYSTYKEKGEFFDADPDGNVVLGHKSQRLIASTSTAVASTGAFAIGSALATAAGGATVATILLPAGAAIGTAYLANKAANTIIDTERAYEDVDKCFRPDDVRHANLVGAMARVLGNDAYNKSLQEAGVKVDPKTGRVSMATLNAALADEKQGVYAMGRLKGLIMDIRDKDRQVPEPHMPRWIQFTDAQADARQKYEYAKMDARSMDSALSEAVGYVADLKRKRADAAAKAQTDMDEKLKPFNALSAEVQEDIVNKMKRDYPAYKQQVGAQALDEAGYIMAGKITAASDPQIVAAFTKAEADMKPFVDYVADKELSSWKKQNPAATPGDIEAERKQLASDIRHDAIKDPAAFQSKLEKYQAEEQQQPTMLIPLAHPAPAPGTLLVQASDKPAVVAANPRQVPAPA